jgi:hypothetical protein
MCRHPIAREAPGLARSIVSRIHTRFRSSLFRESARGRIRPPAVLDHDAAGRMYPGGRGTSERSGALLFGPPGFSRASRGAWSRDTIGGDMVAGNAAEPQVCVHRTTVHRIQFVVGQFADFADSRSVRLRVHGTLLVCDAALCWSHGGISMVFVTPKVRRVCDQDYKMAEAMVNSEKYGR